MRALIAPLLLALLFSCADGGQSGNVSPPDPPLPPPAPPPPDSEVIEYDRVEIIGESLTANVGDPSVEYQDDGLIGWLAYTDVEGNDFPVGPFHHINIARSDDAGQSWTLIGRALESVEVSITDQDGTTIDGVWAYEVASIVYVQSDSKAPWKLFAHRYLREGSDRLAEYGWITMTSATSPAGPWSEERALFRTASTPFSPFDAEVNVGDLDQSLSEFVALSEPGTLYLDGVLYLTLTGLSQDGPEEIFLLSSDDGGENWSFVSTLLSKADAAEFSASRFDASSLVEIMGEVFLLASPERNGLIHDGTSVFQFEDIQKGSLKRTNGSLDLINHIPVQTDATRSDDRGGGQSDYDQYNVLGGVLFHQVDSDNLPGPIIQIFQTETDLRGR